MSELFGEFHAFQYSTYVLRVFVHTEATVYLFIHFLRTLSLLFSSFFIFLAYHNMKRRNSLLYMIFSLSSLVLPVWNHHLFFVLGLYTVLKSAMFCVCVYFSFSRFFPNGLVEPPGIKTAELQTKTCIGENELCLDVLNIHFQTVSLFLKRKKKKINWKY